MDTCPSVPNIDQADFDDDDIGDPCDRGDVPGLTLSRLRMLNSQYPGVGRWDARAEIGATIVFAMLDHILEGGLVVRLESTVDPTVNEIVFPAADCELVNTRLTCSDPATRSRVTFSHRSAPKPYAIKVSVRSQTFRNPSFNEMPLAFAFQTPNNLLDRRAEIPASACTPKTRGPSCRIN